MVKIGIAVITLAVIIWVIGLTLMARSHDIMPGLPVMLAASVILGIGTNVIVRGLLEWNVRHYY